jgi:hypothetical protein
MNLRVAAALGEWTERNGAALSDATVTRVPTTMKTGWIHPLHLRGLMFREHASFVFRRLTLISPTSRLDISVVL